MYECLNVWMFYAANPPQPLGPRLWSCEEKGLQRWGCQERKGSLNGGKLPGAEAWAEGGNWNSHLKVTLLGEVHNLILPWQTGPLPLPLPCSTSSFPFVHQHLPWQTGKMKCRVGLPVLYLLSDNQMTISFLGVRPRRYRRNVKEVSKIVEETQDKLYVFNSVSVCFGFIAIVTFVQSQVWPISSWVTLGKLPNLSVL